MELLCLLQNRKAVITALCNSLLQSLLSDNTTPRKFISHLILLVLKRKKAVFIIVLS